MSASPIGAPSSLMDSRRSQGRGEVRLLPLAQRLIRRVHLYLGLLVWPFVLLFAITGLSFNHPTVGRGLATRHVSQGEVNRATGFHPWSPEDLATHLVRDLNRRGARYRLVEPASSRFSGFPLFVAPTTQGQRVLILSLSRGHATLTERPEEQTPPPAPFADRFAPPTEFDLAQLATRLDPIVQTARPKPAGPLRPHPAVHPELRFSLQDAQGKRWNAVYDLGTGDLSGRPAEAGHPGAFVELLEAIHTQHHFPPEGGPLSVWALVADLTALTLILWALTGLVMWWQLRKLRKAGAFVLVLGLTFAGLVLFATAREVSFAAESPEQ